MDSISFHAARWPLVFTALLLLVPIGGFAAIVTHSVVLGLLAILLVWCAWNWPAWVLLALILISPIARSGNSAVLPLEVITSIKTTVALLLGLTWAVRSMTVRESVSFPRWIMAGLFLWLSLTFLALLHAEDRTLALRYLGLVLAGLSVFCVAYDQTERQKRFQITIALACGFLIAGIVLLQYAIVVYHVGTFLERFVIEPRTQAYYGSNLTPFIAAHYRASGTLSHPNGMGLYFALLIPLTFALLGMKRLTPLQRGGLFGLALVMCAGLYATDSRAAMVYLLMALGYLAWHIGYRWIAGLGAGVILMGIAYVALSPSRQMVLDALSTKLRMEYGLSGRSFIWQNTAAMVRESPLLGKGPGNFSSQYVRHFGFFTPNDTSELMGQLWAIETLGDQVIENFHAHNIYLQLTGEIGILGPLLFLFSVLAVMVHCERTSKRFPKGSFARAIALAMAADAAGLLAYGFFDSQLIFTVGSLNLLAAPMLAMGLNPGNRRSLRTSAHTGSSSWLKSR